MSAQLDLFASSAPINTVLLDASQARTADVWSEVVLAARKQQGSRLVGSRLVITRPFGGIWDRVTEPPVPAAHDDWPALWRFYCWVSPRSSCPATLVGGYQDRRAA